MKTFNQNPKIVYCVACGSSFIDIEEDTTEPKEYGDYVHCKQCGAEFNIDALAQTNLN